MHTIRLACCLLIASSCAGGPALAADITASVKSSDGLAVEDAVVVAVPVIPPHLPSPSIETVEQLDYEFVPKVKPVLIGTSVRFPNKDKGRHHVYSFSPARRFELPLYSGTAAIPAVVFDKAGVVTVGCNIHDWMVAYIYVSESPYFAKTGADGLARLDRLPAGRYTVKLWHPRLAGAERDTARAIELQGSGARALEWEIGLKPDIAKRRPPRRNKG